MRSHLAFLCTIGVLGLATAVEPRLSVFTGLLLVIAFASLTRFSGEKKNLVLALLLAGSCGVMIGMYRFVGSDALQGIAEARGRATSQRAVSMMREILFAQDAVRRHGMIDPDGDGIGSAGRLGELAGTDGVRGGAPLSTPPLSVRFAPRVPTKSGPATEQDGYLMLICLPGAEGLWVTHPSSKVDDEKSESSWIAYAWPASADQAHKAAYFIDEHERILESQNEADAGSTELSQGGAGKSDLRLVGPARPPSCADALVAPTSGHWLPWRNKTPRAELPGLPRTKSAHPPTP